jgi:hypothetical protein
MPHAGIGLTASCSVLVATLLLVVLSASTTGRFGMIVLAISAIPMAVFVMQWMITRSK